MISLIKIYRNYIIMKNKNINEEAYFERIRQLADVKRVVIKESKTPATLLDYKKAGDGRLYGIVKENQSYFIKTAHSRDIVSESDFAYIGGLSNITEYKYKTLTDAQRVLNTKVMTINETYGDVMEDDRKDEEQPPMPQPEPEGVEQSEPPMPEPQPEDQSQAPMPQPEGEPQPKDEIHSAISTAAQLFADADIEPSKVEYYIKQFLGVLKDSQISKLRDDQKSEIYNEYFTTEQVEESFTMNEDMDQQTIEMIIAGIGALGTIGLGFVIDPLKRLLSRTSVGKKIVSGLESAGSAAGDATRSGMSKGKYNESEDHLNEEELYEDDMLDDIEDEDEIGIDTPEMDIEDEIGGNMSVNPNSGSNKELNIDLNSGTVNVKLSEQKIKQLAKKYNVSEPYIKWKVKDMMQEEVKKIEKEKINEQKVRKVVRNIIKEKLGLKKKTLNESVSKERVKLEKLVESVLKKNM